MPKLIKKVALWFDWPDDPHRGRIEICSMTNGEKNEIRDQVLRMRGVYDSEKRQPVMEQEYHRLLDRQLTAVKRISAWENFVDADGNAMERTDGNVKIWAADDDFMRQINEFGAIVDAEAEKQREAVKKN